MGPQESNFEVEHSVKTSLTGGSQDGSPVRVQIAASGIFHSFKSPIFCSVGLCFIGMCILTRGYLSISPVTEGPRKTRPIFSQLLLSYLSVHRHLNLILQVSNGLPGSCLPWAWPVSSTGHSLSVSPGLLTTVLLSDLTFPQILEQRLLGHFCCQGIVCLILGRLFSSYLRVPARHSVINRGLLLCFR